MSKTESEDREEKQLVLEAQKDAVWELYEELQALEVDIDNQEAWLIRMRNQRKGILDILSGKAPLAR